jgi:hypothetical protein
MTRTTANRCGITPAWNSTLQIRDKGTRGGLQSLTTEALPTVLDTGEGVEFTSVGFLGAGFDTSGDGTVVGGRVDGQQAVRVRFLVAAFVFEATGFESNKGSGLDQFVVAFEFVDREGGGTTADSVGGTRGAGGRASIGGRGGGGGVRAEAFTAVLSTREGETSDSAGFSTVCNKINK